MLWLFLLFGVAQGQSLTGTNNNCPSANDIINSIPLWPVYVVGSYFGVLLLILIAILVGVCVPYCKKTEDVEYRQTAS